MGNVGTREFGRAEITETFVPRRLYFDCRDIASLATTTNSGTPQSSVHKAEKSLTFFSIQNLLISCRAALNHTTVNGLQQIRELTTPELMSHPPDFD